MLRYLFATVVLCFVTLVNAEIDVPADLTPWVPWVLHAHPDIECPLTVPNDKPVCQAGRLLALNLNSEGGTFTLIGERFSPGWVVLPGSPRYWPQSVLDDKAPVTVSERGKLPAVWRTPGIYQYTGKFDWPGLPDMLDIPASHGTLSLTVNGNRIGHPNEASNTALWLTKKMKGVPEKVTDHLRLSVSRAMIDNIPFRLVTRYRLEVGGTQREVILPAPYLNGFIPEELDSSLPVQLLGNDSLKVQVKPGVWEISMTSRSTSEVTELTAPDYPSVAQWPVEEIWVFEANPSTRLVDISGAETIDPTQVPINSAWKNKPTYRLTPNQTITFTVTRRGIPSPGSNRLSLDKTMWLDFEGGGYAVRDTINGRVNQAWRLNTDPIQRLGNVTINDETQLITDSHGRTGIEIRQGDIKLVAESRIEGGMETLPAHGWEGDFQSVATTLHLPPGWSVFSITGTDNIPRTWLQRWTLFDLFIVLVTAVTAARVWRWQWGVITLVTLVLVWHESMAPQFIWINLLLATGLIALIPTRNKLLDLLRSYRALASIALVLLLVPFIVMQLRIMIYPQLARSFQPLGYGSVASIAVTQRSKRAVSSDEAYAPAFEKSLQQHSGITQDKSNLNRFDANAKLQTGPGLPQWQWERVNLSWNGPVTADQTVTVRYLTPLMNRVLNALRIALVLVLAGQCLRWLRGKIPAMGKVASLLIPLLLMLGAPIDPAQAEMPDQALLKQLEQRLLEKPACHPQCAAIPTASLEISADQMVLRMEVHVLERTAIAIPGHPGIWMPNKIVVNEQPALLSFNKAGTLHAVLSAGIHTLVLSGPVSDKNNVSLILPVKPHRMTTSLDGWDVTGIDRLGVPAQQIQLTRVQTLTAPTEQWEPIRMPAFVKYDRHFELGLEWKIQHSVTPTSNNQQSTVLHIPLLPGEHVLSPNITVKEGSVHLTLGNHQNTVRWVSSLQKSDELVLTSTSTQPWVELWHFHISPIWHAEFKGVTPFIHADLDGSWLPAFGPRPGETLSVSMTRPEGIPGQTLSLQSSTLETTPGQRAMDARLTLDMRSTQGTKHTITLPDEAELLAVTLNGTTQPIRPVDNTVTLPLSPGKTQAILEWRTPDSYALITHTPEIDVGLSHVNTTLTLSVPRDRWLLWTSGPAMGPAVLFWGLVVTAILAAIILGKVGGTPLGSITWFLLLIGLTQAPLPMILLVVAWFFALSYRGRQAMPMSSLPFNAIQIGLIVLTLIVIGGLLGAVKQGLLGHPSMYVSGMHSSAYVLNWYQDRTLTGYPAALIVSVPLVVYRVLMLLWALWLAFASVSWLRWAWTQFTEGETFKSAPKKVPKNFGTQVDEASKKTTDVDD